MNCRRIHRLLSAYLDEQNAGQERLLVGLHLNRCRNCRQAFEEMRRFRLALLGTPNQPVPSEFSCEWRARLRQERLHAAVKPGPGLPRRLLFAVPAAACALVLILGVSLLRPRTPVVRGGRSQGPTERLTASLPDERPSVEESLPKYWATAPPTDMKPQQNPASPFGSSAETAPGTESGGLASAGGDGSGSGYSGSDEAKSSRSASGPTAAATARSPENRPQALPSGGRAATDREAHLTGTWRVWLLAVGPKPASLKRVLAEAGVARQTDDPVALDVPLLLCQGMSYTVAREVAQGIEDAGGRAMVELAP